MKKMKTQSVERFSGTGRILSVFAGCCSLLLAVLVPTPLIAQGVTYSLILQNDSTQQLGFIVYQQPSTNSASSLPLAMLQANVAPETQVLLQWTENYGFYWTTASLQVGVVVTPGGMISASSLSSGNSVIFDAGAGTPEFTSQTTSQSPGKLFLLVDANVANNTFGVGMTIDEKPVIIVPAIANTQNTFTPSGQYHVAPSNLGKGAVIDPNELIGTALTLIFPPNVSELTAIFGPDATWTME